MRKISTKTACLVFYLRFQRSSHSCPTNFSKSNYKLPGPQLKKSKSRVSVRGHIQKQLSRCVLRERCSENMQQFTGEHPCRSAISIKLRRNFIEITLRHGYSLVNLLHIFRKPLPKNTSRRLLLLINKIQNIKEHINKLLLWSNFLAKTEKSLETMPIFKSRVKNKLLALENGISNKF